MQSWPTSVELAWCSAHMVETPFHGLGPDEDEVIWLRMDQTLLPISSTHIIINRTIISAIHALILCLTSSIRGLVRGDPRRILSLHWQLSHTMTGNPRGLLILTVFLALTLGHSRFGPGTHRALPAVNRTLGQAEEACKPVRNCLPLYSAACRTRFLV